MKLARRLQDCGWVKRSSSMRRATAANLELHSQRIRHIFKPHNQIFALSALSLYCSAQAPEPLQPLQRAAVLLLLLRNLRLAQPKPRAVSVSATVGGEGGDGSVRAGRARVTAAAAVQRGTSATMMITGQTYRGRVACSFRLSLNRASSRLTWRRRLLNSSSLVGARMAMVKLAVAEGAEAAECVAFDEPWGCCWCGWGC